MTDQKATIQQTTGFQRKMAALPRKLEEMAEYARIELQQPEAERVSLIRLSTMLGFFLSDARARQLRREQSRANYVELPE